MCKWIWKLSQGAAGLWADILRAKYFPNGNFFEGEARGSPFWQDLQAIRPAFDKGAKSQVGNGRSTRFWLDFWVGTCPLWEVFPELYALAVVPDQRVAEALDHPLAIAFCRNLNEQEAAKWEALLQLIAPIALTEERDRVSWHLNASGKFSIKSLYHKLCQGSVQLAAKGVWKA